MRRLPAAIAVSVTSHAVVLCWLVWSGSVHAVPLRIPAAPAAPQAGAPAAPASSTATTPAPDEIVLELLDRERDLRDDPRTGAAPAAAPSRARIATGAAGSTAPASARPDAASSENPSGAARPGDTAGDRAPTGAPLRSPYMRMRPPDTSMLGGMSQSFIDDFLARSRPLAPAPDIPGERIGDQIAEERRKLRHGQGSIQRVVELEEERAREDLKPSGGGSFRAEQRTFSTSVAPDGSAQITDKPAQQDTQDVLMKKLFGIDPYAHNKLALLDRTRGQRVAVGERHRRVQLAHAAELALRNVERLWATTPALADRKRGLFELWDDCAETGSDEIVAGGTAARGVVIGAIRARLRGADAYTVAELAALNASRHSKAVFAPYE
jgi:hypothetical protein